MDRRILITLIAISISLAAFLGGYLLSQNDFTKQTANIGEGDFLEQFDNSQQAAEDISPKDLVSLSKGAVLAPTISKEKNSVIYYATRDGRVFEASPRDLNEKTISDKPLPNLINTIWSPNKKEVVSVFDTTNGESFRYYNYQTNKVVDLGTAVKSLAFSPEGSHLAYHKTEGLNGAIYVSAPDGSSPRKIIETRLSDIELSWPSEEHISFKASVDGRDTVYLLSLTGNLTKFIDEPGKVDVLWSSGGTKLLYSTRESGSPLLFAKDASSSSPKALNISTPAYKCAWGINSDYIFCAVGRSSQGGEDIYRISMDGTKDLLSSPVKNISTKQLMLTGTEDYLIVINETDGKIYSLKNPK